MTVGLLILLNAQLFAVLVYAAYDFRKAEQSRRTNRDYYRRDLDLSDALKRSAIASYAIQRGAKKRSAVGAVLTRETHNEQREHENGSHEVVQAGSQGHSPIFMDGADR